MVYNNNNNINIIIIILIILIIVIIGIIIIIVIMTLDYIICIIYKSDGGQGMYAGRSCVVSDRGR